MLDKPSLPFYIKTPLGKAFGLARLEAQALVIEYQWTDRLTGLFRSRIRTVHIPYIAIQNVGLQKRWHGQTTLTLQAQSLMTFRHIPSAAQGFCWLHIQRRDRELAQHFMDHLQIHHSERQLEQWYRTESHVEALESDTFRPQESLTSPVMNSPWGQKLAQLLSRQ